MQYQIQIGQEIGNYVIKKLLGSGGFADVYLANHIHFGDEVAIKVLNKRGFQDVPEYEFREEARKLKDLKHKHIIQIKDFGIQTNPYGRMPYLVMDYAPLGTVSHYYAKKPRLPLSLVVLYVKQIASALQFAHDRQPPIIHLD